MLDRGYGVADGIVGTSLSTVVVTGARPTRYQNQLADCQDDRTRRPGLPICRGQPRPGLAARSGRLNAENRQPVR
jgi:hypothetical protein